MIHNAEFDLAFLDYELSLLGVGHPPLREEAAVLDSLALARERFPGQRNSLDALCKRFEVDASHRRYHGALLDAHLLVDVYLALTAGQGALEFGSEAAAAAAGGAARLMLGLVQLRVRRAEEWEQAAHEARLDAIARSCRAEPVWRRHELAEPALAGSQTVA